MVELAVSSMRSPPVRPKRKISMDELVAQFMKLPLKPVPAQSCAVADPEMVKCFSEDVLSYE